MGRRARISVEYFSDLESNYFATITDYSGKVPANFKKLNDGLPFDWPGNPKPPKCKNGDVYPGSAGCMPLSPGPLPLSGKNAYQGTAGLCTGPDGRVCAPTASCPCDTQSDQNQVSAGKLPTLMLSGRCCQGEV